MGNEGMKIRPTDGDELCEATNCVLRDAVLARVRKSDLGCHGGDNHYLTFRFQQLGDSVASLMEGERGGPDGEQMGLPHWVKL